MKLKNLLKKLSDIDDENEVLIFRGPSYYEIKNVTNHGKTTNVELRLVRRPKKVKNES